MADKSADKPSKEAKTMDVAKPGKTPAPTTSKHVIITNKPEQADPMVTDEAGAKEVPSDVPTETPLPSKSRIKIEPISSDVKPEADTPPAADAANTAAETVESNSAAEPAASDTNSDEKPKDTKPNSNDEDLAAKRAAERQAQLDKIAEARTYYLPINQVVRRRSRHVAIAGAVLIVLLGIAWVDIALDAGLISMPGVKPVTHFFSK